MKIFKIRKILINIIIFKKKAYFANILALYYKYFIFNVRYLERCLDITFQKKNLMVYYI